MYKLKGILRGALLILFITAYFTLIVACKPVDTTRYIPLRWVELHDSRHTECQLGSGGPFVGPIPTRNPSAWRTSEWINWMIGRMNTTYEGTGIQFWLQSHDAYCTQNLASLYRSPDTKETWAQTMDFASVKAELWMLYPHAKQYDMSGDSLQRMKWIEKAFMLYGDRHEKTIYFHDDFLPSGAGQGANLPLPQHGFGPWYTPGVVFMFLSGITWAPDWAFDPELTVAHEIGHSLGNCHTLDFEKFCVNGGAVFPGGIPYTWADHWDLSYVRISGAGGADEIKGFESRDQAVQWIKDHGTADIHRIDDEWNIMLDPLNGKMTVQLEYDPKFTFSSDSQVPSVSGGKVTLLQGLSFPLAYTHTNPPANSAWQRNHMAYRYAQQIDPNNHQAAVNPFDYLTARFSRSQIEIMQKQLAGSNPLLSPDYGTHPPGTDSLFASMYTLLGDGQTEDFIWYSNGEGPANVDSTDAIEDRIAFRSAPAGTTGYHSGETLVSGDFNADGLTDLVWYGKKQWDKFLWSWVDNQGSVRGVQHFDEDAFVGPPNPNIADYAEVFTGDFDGNGADDLFAMRSGESKATITYFRKDPTCRTSLACALSTKTISFDPVSGPVAVGNFDGVYGNDIIWGTYNNGKTTAHVVWSNADGSFTPAALFEVGNAEYAPHAGNFNGNGGEDVLWHTWKGQKDIFWWGRKATLAPAGKGQAQRFSCGPGGSWDCVDTNWGAVSLFPRVTIGDFDGNSADDILVQEMHDPYLYFSNQGDYYTYTGNNTQVRVALHNSSNYVMTVGEFDGLKDENGQWGDDIYLIFRLTGGGGP